MKKDEYTFGDNDRAAARLELLARVFEPTTRVFLCRALGFCGRRPTSVLDVGAGPGATTELLAEILSPRELVGIDSSGRYVEQARRRGVRATAGPAHFEELELLHDPLPGAAFDFVYSRHLLTHLSDVPRALSTLVRALAPGGVLALEETSSMHSEGPIFERYYAIVRALQAHHGQRMNIGGDLSRLACELGLDVRMSFQMRTLLDPMAMARLHVENLATWRQQAFIRQNYADSELDDIGAELTRVAEGRPSPPVEVTLGQLVVRGA